MRTQIPLTKKRRNHFLAHVCCGQMAAWIKMSLGIEADLGPSNFVLDGNPAPLPQKGVGAPPQLSAMPIVAKLLDGSR